MDLKNKTVVITGGSKGLGKSLAQFFKEENSKVIICSKNDSEIKQEANALGVTYFTGDVTKEEDMINLAEFAVKEFNSLDIWINNAGVLYGNIEAEDYLNIEKSREMLDVNLFGVIFGMRSALKQMKVSKNGLIVNIISSSAIDPSRALLNKIYAASKCAVDGYTKASALEYKDFGVKILSVYPGGIITDLWRNQKPADLDRYMNVDFVAKKIVENIKTENPELNLIIKRQNI